MNNSFKIFLAFVALVLPIFASENSILVLTPNKWYEGFEQTIYIDLQPIQNETSIDLLINLANTENKNIKFNFSQTVTSNTSQLIKFYVPSSFINGYYNLTIIGSNQDGFQFKNITKGIYFTKETSNIHLITDKSTYKPSETVNIRVVGLNHNFMPIKNETCSVFIKDPESNIVFQKLNLSFADGFIDDLEFQLSDRPIYGQWSINLKFKLNSQDKVTFFDVKEYVLPKFSVNLNLPKYIYKSSNYLEGSCEAKYTYGKNVFGKLKIELIQNQYNYHRPIQHDDQKNLFFMFELSPSGKTNFKIPLSLNSYYYMISVNATVYDEYSGEARSDFKSLNVYDTKIYSSVNNYYFKLNETNDYIISVYNPVNEPYLNEKVILEIFKTTNLNYQQVKVGSYKLTTDSNGKIYKSYYVDSNTTQLIFKISLVKELKETSTIYLYKYYNSYTDSDTSSNNNFLKIDSSNKNFKQNQIKTLTIKKNYNQSKCINVNYLIISRSVIRNHSGFELCDQYNLTLNLKYINIPKTNIIFYFINSTKDVQVHNYLLESDDIFSNYIDMNFGVSTVNPGDIVNLTVKTNINSTISLCIVDQSVRLMSKPNELARSDIENEFNQFNLNPYYPSNDHYQFESNENSIIELDEASTTTPRYNRYYSYWEYPQAVKDFHSNGFIVLTDFKSLRAYLISDFQNYYDYLESHIPIYEMDANREPAITASMQYLTTTTFGSQNKPSPPNQQENLVDVTQVRTDFSELWLWKKMFITNEMTLISSKIPDTITSWIATGFSVHPSLGIAIAPSLNITTFKSFFISIQLPYCIKRGEILILKAIVYNYLSIDLTNVYVTFLKTNDFKQVKLINQRKQIVDITNDIRVKIPFIKSQTGHTVTFIITPTKIGSLKIQINAQSRVAADAESKQILVKSEGVEQSITQSLLIDMNSNNNNSFQDVVFINFPTLIVPDSKYCKLQLVGDIMGTAFNNLNSLLNIPSGCGEQNMIGLTPNIYALMYLLSKKNMLNLDALITTAKRNIQIGYTNELKYRHSDGSFSAFGQSDSSGSSWLTAFVLKSFSQANKYIQIDDKILQSAAEWLIRQQQQDGSFNEPGNVIHKDMQSGANSKLTLTAYILISLIEANLSNSNLKPIQNATSFIESQLSKINDVYSATLVAYALDLANSNLKQTAFNKFNSYANRTFNDKTFWTKNERRISNDFYLIRETPTSDIEMTSYGLLIYLNRNESNKDEIFKIAKWIISKSSSLGGYSSTQDTILALQALSEFANKILPSSDNTSLSINVTLDSNKYSKIFYVDYENLLVLQSWTFPTCPSYVRVYSYGIGISLLQITTIYNVPKIDCKPFCLIKTESSKSIELTQNVSKLITNNTILIKTCIKYNKNDITGMSIIESELVSGFDVDDQNYLNNLPKTDSTGTLMLAEKMKNTNKIAFYLQSMPSKEYCIEWKMIRLHQVADAKNVTVTAYDYYSTDLRATIQFSIPSTMTNLNSLINN